MERCLVLGDIGLGGETASITTFAAMLVLAEFELFKKRRELLICDKGTELDDDDVLTVFTFVSDNERSFLTASGECAPSRVN